MHNNLTVGDSPNSQEDSNLDNSKASTEIHIQKKRKRGPAVQKWSKKEEDRILKYALKLSEKEYQAKSKKEESKAELKNIEPCTVVQATEEDFKNILGFFDKLWSKEKSSTGIIKVIPPESWVQNQRTEMDSTFLPRFKEPGKKLVTRKQILNQLYMAKVINNIRYLLMNSPSILYLHYWFF